jgi:hypothetical protein
MLTTQVQFNLAESMTQLKLLAVSHIIMLMWSMDLDDQLVILLLPFLIY